MYRGARSNLFRICGIIMYFPHIGEKIRAHPSVVGTRYSQRLNEKPYLKYKNSKSAYKNTNPRRHDFYITNLAISFNIWPWRAFTMISKWIFIMWGKNGLKSCDSTLPKPNDPFIAAFLTRRELWISFDFVFRWRVTIFLGPLVFKCFQHISSNNRLIMNIHVKGVIKSGDQKHPIDQIKAEELHFFLPFPLYDFYLYN